MTITSGYLAGVMDSDGSFSITIRHKTRPNANYICMIQISWKYTDISEKFMKKLCKMFGGTYHINSRKYKSSYKNSSTIIKYCATGKAVDRIVDYIFDNLILKKKQAKNILKLRQLVGFQGAPGKTRPKKLSNKMHKLYELNKELNTKNNGDRRAYIKLG